MVCCTVQIDECYILWMVGLLDNLLCNMPKKKLNVTSFGWLVCWITCCATCWKKFWAMWITGSFLKASSSQKEFHIVAAAKFIIILQCLFWPTWELPFFMWTSLFHVNICFLCQQCFGIKKINVLLRLIFPASFISNGL